MLWKTKKMHLTHSIVIFALLQESGTNPAVSLQYACMYQLHCLSIFQKWTLLNHLSSLPAPSDKPALILDLNCIPEHMLFVLPALKILNYLQQEHMK